MLLPKKSSLVSDPLGRGCIYLTPTFGSVHTPTVHCRLSKVYFDTSGQTGGLLVSVKAQEEL